jgi:hypothetical protein
MKKLTFVLAAGLLTLAACNKTENTNVENAAENTEAALENTADNLEAAADNATNESTEAALENAADNAEAAADNAEAAVANNTAAK